MRQLNERPSAAKGNRKSLGGDGFEPSVPLKGRKCRLRAARPITTTAIEPASAQGFCPILPLLSQRNNASALLRASSNTEPRSMK